MHSIDRKKEIIALLNLNGKVSVVELSNRFKVSEETIRRDLLQMENESLVKKVHGGAVKNSVRSTPTSYIFRKEVGVEDKKKIASACLPLVQEGASVFLDSSSTALYVAKAIKNIPNIAIITNSHFIISELLENSVAKVVCIGGELHTNLQCYQGFNTIDEIKKYRTDIAFVSCTSLSICNGMTDSDDLEGRIRLAMLNCSKKKYLVVDNSKFDDSKLFHIADFDILDGIVTDKLPSLEWQKALSEKKVELFVKEGE